MDGSDTTSEEDEYEYEYFDNPLVIDEDVGTGSDSNRKKNEQDCKKNEQECEKDKDEICDGQKDKNYRKKNEHDREMNIDSVSHRQEDGQEENKNKWKKQTEIVCGDGGNKQKNECDRKKNELESEKEKEKFALWEQNEVDREKETDRLALAALTRNFNEMFEGNTQEAEILLLTETPNNSEVNVDRSISNFCTGESGSVVANKRKQTNETNSKFHEKTTAEPLSANVNLPNDDDPRDTIRKQHGMQNCGTLKPSKIRKVSHQQLLNNVLNGRQPRVVIKPLVHTDGQPVIASKPLVHNDRQSMFANKSQVQNDRQQPAVIKPSVRSASQFKLVNKTLVHTDRQPKVVNKTLVHTDRQPKVVNKTLVHTDRQPKVVNKTLVHTDRQPKVVNKTLAHTFSQSNIKKTEVLTDRQPNVVNKTLMHSVRQLPLVGQPQVAFKPIGHLVKKSPVVKNLVKYNGCFLLITGPKDKLSLVNNKTSMTHITVESAKGNPPNNTDSACNTGSDNRTKSKVTTMSSKSKISTVASKSKKNTKVVQRLVKCPGTDVSVSQNKISDCSISDSINRISNNDERQRRKTNISEHPPPDDIEKALNASSLNTERANATIYIDDNMSNENTTTEATNENSEMDCEYQEMESDKSGAEDTIQSLQAADLVEELDGDEYISSTMYLDEILNRGHKELQLNPLDDPDSSETPRNNGAATCEMIPLDSTEGGDVDVKPDVNKLNAELNIDNNCAELKVMLCKVCNSAFDSIADFDQHLSICDSDAKKSKICKTCRVGFIDLISFYTHNCEPPEDRTGFRCNVCSKTYQKRDVTFAHLKSHKGIKDFVCEFCQKAFLFKHHLNHHMKCHLNDRAYKCQVCSATFKRLSNLKKHHLTHQENRPTFKCDLCDKTFVQKYHLYRHGFSHGLHRKKFTCDICNFSFAENNHLQRHIKTVHSSKKRKRKPAKRNGTQVKCKVCNLPFSWKKHLQAHMKTRHPEFDDDSSDACDEDDEFNIIDESDVLSADDETEQRRKKDGPQKGGKLKLSNPVVQETDCERPYNTRKRVAVKK